VPYEYQGYNKENVPNLPGMGANDVGFPVHIPEGLRVITNKVEVHSIGPRLGTVRVLALEDDL
jgi:hypothetical protein